MPESNRRFHSIQVDIAIAFAALSVAIIVAAILIAFTVTEESARQSSRRYTRELVRQITNNIEFYIDYMDSVSSIIEASPDVQEYLRAAGEDVAAGGPGGPAADDPAAAGVRQILRTLANARSDISLIALFDNGGGFITADSGSVLNPFTDLQRQSWYSGAKNVRGGSLISPSHVQNIIAGRYQWVISLSRELIDPESGSSLGVLLADLNYRIIERICASIELGRRGYIFIVDRNGDIVYHPQQQLLYSGLKTENIRRVIEGKEDYFSGDNENREKFYSVQTMPLTGWKVVGVNYRSEFVEGRDAVRATYTFWGLLFLAAAMGMSVVLALRISRPIRQLRASMRAVEQGSFDIRADIRSSNEIGELGKDFNIMIGEIKNLLARVTAEQEQKRKSELKALQMQINPHFLYNTLDSVIWMARSGKEDEVIAMSSALARLFRLSISKGKEIIDVASELEHVRSYLTIQKIRYKDRLDYSIDVDEDIMSCRIVKIILQPLAENAIYHGIKNNFAGGTVRISGRRTETGMILQVRDDGAGMDGKALEKLRRALAPGGGADSVYSERGVGVHNVDERIKLYFGREYGLEFESREDEGTTVTVQLPAIKREDEP
ncbi:MAG: sensor histidine kinase [Treponema sp.]|jgi:two-component system sensor histidine kinase YesM|nr:sensor histidine kinase [Treponema sp.]